MLKNFSRVWNIQNYVISMKEIFLVSSENKSKAEEVVKKDDLVSRSSIAIRSAAALGIEEDGYFIIIDGSEEAIKKAEELLNRAKADVDIENLKKIGETYSASSVGKQAFSYLAAHYLEQGASELGAIYLKKILQFSNKPDLTVVARLVQALDQLGRDEEKARFMQWLREEEGEALEREFFFNDLEMSELPEERC